jgi:hypothetical protein
MSLAKRIWGIPIKGRASTAVGCKFRSWSDAPFISQQKAKAPCFIEFKA